MARFALWKKENRRSNALTCQVTELWLLFYTCNRAFERIPFLMGIWPFALRWAALRFSSNHKFFLEGEL